ncbi:MAG: hypothetical protein H6810_07645 [Phycisphaeraceae bacterium]|nr:MAG: hypothetical protein H6810_07645 [Phycisphaeraceae bacterium]
MRTIVAVAAGVLAAAHAHAQVTLEMNLYADIDGQTVGPDEQQGLGVGQVVHYRLMAEMSPASWLPAFTEIDADILAYECGGQAEVLNFQYGDWADATDTPFIDGDSIIGVHALQFGFDTSNPVEVCSFDVRVDFWFNLYVARGNGPGGVAFTVDGFDTFGPSVFHTPRVIAVGGPGDDYPCSPADMAQPYGVHDLADIMAFLRAFARGDCLADFRPPWAVFDLTDVQVFIESFLDGCQW